MKLTQITESMEHFRDLFDFSIEGAKVVNYDDWDEDEEVIKIDGTRYELGSEVGDVDSFLNKHGTGGLVLFKSSGYRGTGCYSGYMKVGGKEYTLDIMNDYLVYEIEPQK